MKETSPTFTLSNTRNKHKHFKVKRVKEGERREKAGRRARCQYHGNRKVEPEGRERIDCFDLATHISSKTFIPSSPCPPSRASYHNFSLRENTTLGTERPSWMIGKGNTQHSAAQREAQKWWKNKNMIECKNLKPPLARSLDCLRALFLARLPGWLPFRLILSASYAYLRGCA